MANTSQLRDSVIFGCVSSAFTTVIYQPLELVKTRAQLQSDTTTLFGSIRHLTRELVKTNGTKYLWRGTGASIVRSVPGVGLYYGFLTALQSNFSSNHKQPDSPLQAFYFGLLSRSLVSFSLLPVTVLKVRYESGLYNYSSLTSAILKSYERHNWVGVVPTLLRDSLFSGIYYMCYTKLKSQKLVYPSAYLNEDLDEESGSNEERKKPGSLLNFYYGIVSGLVASIITNPLDVLKTRAQVNQPDSGGTLKSILNSPKAHLIFFRGLVPRSVRRSLVASSTWSFYEFFMDKFGKRQSIS